MTEAGRIASLSLLMVASNAWAEEEVETAAKQVENPIAPMVTLQLQNRLNYLIGPNERTANVMSLRARVPFALTSTLSLTNLLIVPLVWSPDVANPTGTTFGMGDIGLESLLVGNVKGIFDWGVGPVFSFPTGTDKRLGSFDSGQFSLGPEVSLVVTPHHFVLGLSVKNVWSVAGRDGSRTVNTMTLQPIIDYNFPRGWYLTSTPNIVSDWTVPDNKGWLVPIGGGFGWVGLFGKRAGIDFEVQAYWNVVRPDPGPLWTMRFVAALFFPKPPAKPRSP